MVHLPSEGDLLLVDDEGLIKGREPNKTATILAQQPICGDVLIVSEQGEDFGDVDPDVASVTGTIYLAVNDLRFARCPSVEIPVNSDLGRSKKLVLSVRSQIMNEDETLNELRAAVAVCENELIKGARFHTDDLFIYCTALHNLIAALESQMDEDQRKNYKMLLERSTVITTVK